LAKRQSELGYLKVFLILCRAFNGGSLWVVGVLVVNVHVQLTAKTWKEVLLFDDVLDINKSGMQLMCRVGVGVIVKLVSVVFTSNVHVFGVSE
jgi:hypothetical protein